MKSINLNKNKVALVDDDMFDYLNQFTWRLTSDGRYATRAQYNNGVRTRISMHREIMGFPENNIIDHIDQDGLNNQRTNLRLATKPTNAWNGKSHRDSKIKYKGVSITNKSYKRIDSKGEMIYYIYPDCYVACICKDGVHYCCGTYKTPEDAARAYDKKAIELFGEFANTNFPVSDHTNEVIRQEFRSPMG